MASVAWIRHGTGLELKLCCRCLALYWNVCHPPVVLRSSYCPCTTYWLHFKLVVRLLIYQCGYIHRFGGSKFPSFCVPSLTAIRLQAWSSSLTWFLLPNVHRKYVRHVGCDYGAKLPIGLSICWLANANFSSSACFSVFLPFRQQGW